LYSAALTNANLAGAQVQGADFGYTSTRGFTYSQLASTLSFQQQNLTGIGLEGNDLTGWNLSGQNLTNARFYYATLTNANLAGAQVQGADFGYTTGFTYSQLSSTLSFSSKTSPASGWNTII